MKFISGQFKQLLLIVALLLQAAIAFSQGKQSELAAQRKNFYYLLGQANISFTFPRGFREIKAINNEDFSFDYAMDLPDQDFEIWFQVHTLKRNAILYLETAPDQPDKPENPDSLYVNIGKAQARAFTGSDDYTVRIIPPETLAHYNADAGKTYLLTLPDLPETKHYKYALLITLQKHHVGNILAVCFTNSKNADFFKNLKRASDCMKFRPLK